VIGEKYKLEELLGRGGMGAVYRASHLVSEKRVAVKWMLRSASDEHARGRFMREARLAGRIDHPNVVDVYDVGEDGDCGYLVMELLHGESLRARLERGPLQVAEAVDLLLPAMRGVAAVHQAGVIHRDLKPDNIFLCAGPDGTPREAKVLDFGISAISACDPSDPTLTKEGAILGTPAYMSPEQLQSARDVDARSDVYSFGVILYEALTGKLPFDAESYPGLVLAIVHAQPKPLTELRPELPRELGALVLRALAKRREDRFPTIESLMTALAAFAGARSEASAELASLPAVTGAGRHARLWLVAAALLTALALVLAAWWWPSGRGPSAERPAPHPQPTAAASSAGVANAPADHAPSAPSPPVLASETALRASPDAASVLKERSSAAEPKSKTPRHLSPRNLPRHAVDPVAPVRPAAKQRSGSISVDEL
jgi:serine/threonine-protein kinase